VKPILLGTPDDALGFALSGAATVTAASRDGVEQAIRRISTTVDDPVFIFSREAAELIPDTIRQWTKRGSGPMFVVLPGK
jgi:vacuolar-type H+-ATPase subunit F/Vma7